MEYCSSWCAPQLHEIMLQRSLHHYKWDRRYGRKGAWVQPCQSSQESSMLTNMFVVLTLSFNFLHWSQKNLENWRTIVFQWAVLFEGFMVESKWLAITTDQSPAAEDYLRNAVVTSGVPLTFAHLFFLLGQDHHATTCTNGDAAKLSDHRIVIPPAISCPAKILRLWDDMGSAKVCN